MSSRHLGQYKGNFFIVDEVLIANLSPAKAPVSGLHGCVFKLFRFHILAFSNRSNLVCVFIIVFIVSV